MTDGMKFSVFFKDDRLLAARDLSVFYFEQMVSFKVFYVSSQKKKSPFFSYVYPAELHCILQAAATRRDSLIIFFWSTNQGTSEVHSGSVCPHWRFKHTLQSKEGRKTVKS